MAQELITIDSFRINATNAVVSANFSEMRGLIAQVVENHLSLVTPETIGDSKALIADFRKTSKALAAAWKEKRIVAITDIMAADAQVKELCALLDDGANDMAEQVKKLEEEVKQACLSMLLSLREALWREKAVRNEFCTATVDDLVKLGSLNTKRDDLTKAAKEAVLMRVNADLANQTKIDGRLTKVEAECLKADITPFSMAAVVHFLYADDFDTHLKALIDAEIARRVAAEEKLRAKLEAEKQREIDAALKAQQAEADRLAREAAAKLAQDAAQKVVQEAAAEADAEARRKQAQTIYPEPVDRNPPAPADDGKVFFTVSLTLAFQAKPAPDAKERIERFMLRKMADNGLTVKSILVERMAEHV
jgi:hypothetical protein